MNVYGKRSQRGSPDAVADQLITELESEFDLMRLERHMADLERKDERLIEKITALKAGIEAPVGTPAYAALREPGPIRRWGRALAAECEIFWLKSRRKRAIGLPPSSSETVASQTCVVRPPWTSFASHPIAPPRLVPTKLLLSSIVVKLCAPSGRFTNVP